MDLTVSVPELTYSLCFKRPEFHCFVSAHAGIWVYVHMFKMPKTVSSKVTKYHKFSTTSQIMQNKVKCLDYRL